MELTSFVGLAGARRRLGELIQEQERVQGEIARLAVFENKLDSLLVAAIRFNGDDFDEYWRSHSEDAETREVFLSLLTRIAGRPLTRSQFEHRLEAAWLRVAADLATADEYDGAYTPHTLARRAIP